MAAIAGIISIIFRQTNITWVFFMALCNVIQNLHRYSVCALIAPNSHHQPYFLLDLRLNDSASILDSSRLKQVRSTLSGG